MSEILTPLLSALAALVAAALAYGVGMIRGQRTGRQAARADMLKKDWDNATAIQDRADAARRADDAGHVEPAVDRLRRAGRLRD